MQISAALAAQLHELATEHGDGPIEGWWPVAHYERDSGRWMQHMWLVLQSADTGEHWAAEFAYGLTEDQPHEFPWRDHPHSPVTLIKVESVEVTELHWRRKS